MKKGKAAVVRLRERASIKSPGRGQRRGQGLQGPEGSGSTKGSGPWRGACCGMQAARRGGLWDAGPWGTEGLLPAGLALGYEQSRGSREGG